VGQYRSEALYVDQGGQLAGVLSTLNSNLRKAESLMPKDNALWDWVVAIYQREGVAERCLWFQNQRAADVPLMLFICWVVTRCGALDHTLLSRARQAATLWHKDVVVPLRQMRRLLKIDSKGMPAEPARRFREEIKSVELQAERVELAALAMLVEEAGSVDVDPQALRELMFDGLARYLDGLPFSAGELDHDRLNQLVAAING